METPIIVPAELQSKVERQARALGMTFNEFVCKSLEQAVAMPRPDDPLFTDTAVYREDISTDAALNHDDDLYGDAS